MYMSMSYTYRSALVTKTIRSASCNIRRVDDVCSSDNIAFVPGVSIKQSSDNKGYFFVGNRCNCVRAATFSKPMELLSNTEDVPLSFSLDNSSSLAIKIVIASVVGNTPASNSSSPSSALINVLFPELNSPANTTVNNDCGCIDDDDDNDDDDFCAYL